MRSSQARIRTTHAGSLPRPDDLIEFNRARQAGEPVDEDAFRQRLHSSVTELVQRQRDTGIDVVNDGEYGHAAANKVDYGAWWTYSFSRLGGLELTDATIADIGAQQAETGKVKLTSFGNRRDWVAFREAYADPTSAVVMGDPRLMNPVCRAPLTYTGQDAVAADIANLQAALSATGAEEGFLTSVAPGSASRMGNEFYRTDEEFLYACADAMREEYTAIVDAGLILQLDDPCIAENWDQINPAPSVADYKKFTMQRIEALNYAIRDLPKDRIRFHLCWGSWHGPHSTDIAMSDIVDVMLAVDCQAYVFEAGNVRHEHEWKVWNEISLPDGKIIIPGVVSHATNVVEHPELVADRITRFAGAVGRENVIAGTDCGLGGRVHRQIAWAKLESLAAGAQIATQRLWG